MLPPVYILSQPTTDLHLHPGKQHAQGMQVPHLSHRQSSRSPGPRTGGSVKALQRRLEQRRIAWKRCGRSLSYLDQTNDLKDLRESGTRKPANYSACQDVLRRLDKAFQAFFRRLKDGGKPGFPRFKSRDRYDSFTFPAYGDGCRVRENGKLYLQGVGEIRVKWHREIAGKIKTVTVRRRAGH